jgi:4-amino-4-deoxy-L-arabinose transferase-like glycosyltransferase
MAIFDMNKHGLAIFPGDGNVELTKGHPLLFYFLSALWTRIFGTSLVMVHIFPLLISCLLITAVFLLAREVFDPLTALASVVLFMLQSEFLAQSTLLLPEVMLALWAILALVAYFRRKWILYGVFSVLLVMTKETGIILSCALILDKLFLENFFSEKKDTGIRNKIRELFILAIPLVVFAAFMITQKIRSGWFLFPDHVNRIVIDPETAVFNFKMILTKLFFLQGKNILFLFSLALAIYLIVTKSISKQIMHRLLVFLLFILFYTAFCSVNFFTTRYLLCVLPVFIIAGTGLISSALKHNWLKGSVLTTFALLFAYHSFIGYRNEQDISLGFKDSVLIQKQAVNYAEKMNWQQKSIYSAFLMQYYMGIPELGYLNDPDKAFHKVWNDNESDYNLHIFCSNENDPSYAKIKEESGLVLLKRFERGRAWVEIYGNRIE